MVGLIMYCSLSVPLPMRRDILYYYKFPTLNKFVKLKSLQKLIIKIGVAPELKHFYY